MRLITTFEVSTKKKIVKNNESLDSRRAPVKKCGESRFAIKIVY